MSLLRRLLSSLCLAIVCAQFAHAQLVAEEVAAANWVVGDTYTVEVTRAGVTEQFSGELVHVDEQWVSLLEVLPGKNFGVQTKTGSRLFKNVSRSNVGIGRERRVQLVPADAVQIAEHQPGAGKALEEPLPAWPKVGDTVAIQYAEHGKLTTARGELTNISADRWSVTEKSGVATKRSIPVLGELPLVGGMFTQTVFVMKTNDAAVPVADVLSIQFRGPAFFERVKVESDPE
jgi:hypothetical protein